MISINSILFVFISTQLLYILLHFQYLLGMPKAAWAVNDALYFLIAGAGLFTLSLGDKTLYSIACFVILLPTIQLQYHFIKMFNKVFTLSEMVKFPTLVRVSVPLVKIFYLGLFAVWFSGLCYILYKFSANWLELAPSAQIITAGILIYYTYVFIAPTTGAHVTWNPLKTFQSKGILSAIRHRPHAKPPSKKIVTQSCNYLKELESQRAEYPPSASSETIPFKKRPIVMIVFESFYDYRHFIPLFDKDPFPQEYRDIANNCTGPNQTHGSFYARFVSFTSSLPMDAPIKNTDYSHSLVRLLKDYGYHTVSFDSVSPTYDLDVYYPSWGFDSSKFMLFGDDWDGTHLDPYSYEDNLIKTISDTPDDVTPFYFGFTYLGHQGSNAFTNRLPDPDADSFIELFGDKVSAKQLLKAAIFNARRIVKIKNSILKKYPDALIIFKADHLNPEFRTLLDNPDNTIPQNILEDCASDPAPLPFIVLDGSKGNLPLPKAFPPANIPVMILAECGLPYRGTALSLLYRTPPSNSVMIYDNFYDKTTCKALDIYLDKHSELLKYYNAVSSISRDLYHNHKSSYTLSLLEQRPEPFTVDIE